MHIDPGAPKIAQSLLSVHIHIIPDLYAICTGKCVHEFSRDIAQNVGSVHSIVQARPPEHSLQAMVRTYHMTGETNFSSLLSIGYYFQLYFCLCVICDFNSYNLSPAASDLLIRVQFDTVPNCVPVA